MYKHEIFKCPGTTNSLNIISLLKSFHEQGNIFTKICKLDCGRAGVDITIVEMTVPVVTSEAS